jgi:hypothetical protein
MSLLLLPSGTINQFSSNMTMASRKVAAAPIRPARSSGLWPSAPARIATPKASWMRPLARK